jgi:hypothetical protein
MGPTVTTVEVIEASFPLSMLSMVAKVLNPFLAIRREVSSPISLELSVTRATF